MKNCSHCESKAETMYDDLPCCHACRVEFEAEDREHWENVNAEIEYIAGLPEVPPW